MGDNVINLATELKDGTKQSPEMCLRDCLSKDIGKRGAFKDGKKLVILALDDTDGQYTISWCQAGMKMSEMISMMEVAKATMLSDMGY